MEFRNNDHFKSYMKKEATRLGISVNATYSTYFSRMLLEKLTSFNYGELLVKGSFSQYVHTGKLSRPVLDVDLTSALGHNVPLTTLYRTIYDQNSDEITFDISRLPNQTPNGVYKIPVVASVKHDSNDRAINQSINVDFKESNPVIFETQYKPVEPLFTGDNRFFINTPSFEEHIAEKLYIIAHNRKIDTLNTRVKDFYDIFQLHGGSYDPDKFSIYFLAMLMLYGEDISLLSTNFLNRDFVEMHEQTWDNMSRKYEFVDKDLDLLEAVYYTRAVLSGELQKSNNNGIRQEAMKLVRARQK